VVVDPLEDIEVYQRMSRDTGMRIVHVIRRPSGNAATTIGFERRFNYAFPVEDR